MNTEELVSDWPYWTEPQRADIDGWSTAYRRKGEGDPLLYLHAAGPHGTSMTRAWLPFYEALCGGFDVIVPEHPGFGDTPMPDWLAGMDDLVLHYDELVRAFGAEGAHLVGHGLGGWLAAYLAIFYPERFRSLTLIAPVGLRVPDTSIADPFRMSPEMAVETFLSGAPTERYAEYFQRGEEIESTIHAYRESISLARLMWNPRYDITLDRRLGRIRIPTLVVAAEDDRFVPSRQAERWSELIPGAQLSVLPGEPGERTSHLMLLQRPTQLADAVAAHAATA